MKLLALLVGIAAMMSLVLAAPALHDSQEVIKLNARGELGAAGYEVGNAQASTGHDLSPSAPQACVNLKSQLRRSPPTDDVIALCHEPNLGGSCLCFTKNDIGGCHNNPFNVDPVKSLDVRIGWQCAIYHESDCKATKSPPHYEAAKNSDKIINQVPYEVWSFSCEPIPCCGKE